MPSPIRAAVFAILVALPLVAIALLSQLVPPPPTSAANSTPRSLSLAKLTAVASTRTPSPATPTPNQTPTASPAAASSATLTPVPAVTATAAPDQPTPAATATPTAAPSGKLQIGNTDGMGVNLRVDPGSGGAILRLLEPGTAVTSAGEDRKVGETTWRKVTDTEGNTGWVSGDFLVPVP